MNKFKRRNLTPKEFNFKILLKRCFIFLCVFLALYVLSALIVSAIFYSSADPTSKINIASMLCIFISVFISGYIMAKINNQKLFLGGLILGFMIMLLDIVLCLIFNDISITDLPILLAIPAICILGSMLGKKREHKKFRARRYIK